jgi:ribosomal protein S18 acetylase RimI-like enzyme
MPVINDVKWTIGLAEHADVPALIELRREAERWLAAAGIDQWTEKWMSVADEKTIRAVRQRRAYAIASGAEIAATVTLGGPDEDLWHPSDGPALYLYKLIVARKYAGQGLGEMILDWACDTAADWGYPCLRLDAWPSNPKLLDYYRAHGFSDVRVATVEGRDTGAMMERPAVRISTPHLVEVIRSG